MPSKLLRLVETMQALLRELAEMEQPRPSRPPPPPKDDHPLMRTIGNRLEVWNGWGWEEPPFIPSGHVADEEGFWRPVDHPHPRERYTRERFNVPPLGEAQLQYLRDRLGR
jgi:hypothetical protein